MRTFTLLSTSDTDLLSARTSDSEWRLGNPYRVGDLAEFAAGTDLVVVRILGSRRKYEDMVAPLLGLGVPVVVLGGEQLPDAELMGLSTVPMGVATEAHAYLAQGGPDNIVQLHRFLADTVLLDGEGFEAPAVAPDWGLLERETTATGPRVAVLYYRAHHLAGNTAFVHTLCAAI
ncbi:cobaltochelatase subunit CobN, partial [Modestobacter roseus]